MTESVQTALIASIVPAITAIGVIVVATRQKVAEKKVDDLHIVVNSRLSELLRITTESERAKGKLEGQTEEKLASIGAKLSAAAATPQTPIPVKIEAPDPVPVIVVEPKK